MTEAMEPVRLAGSVLSRSCHVCAFFHSKEEEYRVLMPFIKDGFERIFGHPEVYILILPAFGLVSEIIPVFSRKPLFGYAVMVYAIAAIAFLGFGVWVHHMFTTGLGPTPVSAFSAATMLIAIPTGVKILNWTATMWGGSLKFTTPMLFAVGLVSQFVIGGLSGVMHSVVPVDTQQNDTYFIVAHFHYVLFGGSIFALMGAIYFYWPKAFGKLLDERLGKIQFWLQFAGFNLTFFPMHFLGLAGMPRRYSTYSFESGWWFWNVIATIGALMIATSVLVFLINVLRTAQSEQSVGPNPWEAATLEWAIPSPPPVYNFRIIPFVTHRDQLWHDQYDRALEASGRPDRVADAIVEVDQLPSTRASAWPWRRRRRKKAISISRTRRTIRSWRGSASSCWPSAFWSTIPTSSSGSSGFRSSPRSGSWRW